MRRLALPIIATVAAATALVGAGCGSSDTGDLMSQVTTGEWVLDTGASSAAVRRAEATTIRFANDGTVSGTAPCNSYAGTFALSGSSAISITGLSQTQRSCGARTDAAERAYLDALGAVTTIAPPSAGTLALTGSDGSRLVFSALDPATAIVGRWDVVNVSRDDAIRGVSPGLDPVVTFASDGTVTTSGTCGRRTGTWSVDGDRLTVTGLSAGAGTCAPTGDPSRDEAAIAAGLGAAAGVTVTPAKLTALNADGHIVLVANR